ncbi:unnamed protein product [Notodromas monacha]|uniref:CCHC-type domain-containing protein n=1 Tax=Notodromas monacha TaxID=399045 RepID=A0A7R9BJB9_9CRUS|nr:unnamed protein product [Notodromas monacha]CAG0915029.1 unnamed protein product [Notodromas monacha]
MAFNEDARSYGHLSSTAADDAEFRSLNSGARFCAGSVDKKRGSFKYFEFLTRRSDYSKFVKWCNLGALRPAEGQNHQGGIADLDDIYKIPVFRGDGKWSWNDWWTTFQMTIVDCQVSVEKLQSLLLQKLGGSAKRCILIAGLSNAPYEEIVEEMEAQYGEEPVSKNMRQCLAALDRTVQRDTEAVSHFANRIKRAAELYTRGMIHKESILKIMIKEDGSKILVPNPSYRNECWAMQGGLSMMDQLLLFHFMRGLRFSIVDKFMKIPEGFSIAVKEAEQVEEMNDLRINRTREEQRRAVVCWMCYKTGHVAKNCLEANTKSSGNDYIFDKNEFDELKGDLQIIGPKKSMKFAFQFSNLIGTVYQGGNVDFTPDGNVLVSPVGNKLWCFNLKNDTAEELPIEVTNNFKFISVSPKGRLLIAVTEDGTALLVDLVARRILLTQKFSKTMKAVKFSPDGKLIGFAKDNGVSIYRAPTVTNQKCSFLGLRRCFNGCYAPVTCLDWSFDSRFVCIGSQDGRICVLSISRCEQFYIQRIPSHTVAVEACFFARDSLDLYSIAKNGQICVWECSVAAADVAFDYENAEDVFEEHKATGSKAAGMEPEKVVSEKLSGYLYERTKKCFLKDPRIDADGKPIHDSVLTAVAFHPGTRTLVTGFSTKDFFAHKMPEVELVQSLDVTDSNVSTAAFSVSGDSLAMGSKDCGQLFVWKWKRFDTTTESTDWMSQMQKIMTLEPKEQAQYVQVLLQALRDEKMTLEAENGDARNPPRTAQKIAITSRIAKINQLEEHWEKISTTIQNNIKKIEETISENNGTLPQTIDPQLSANEEAGQRNYEMISYLLENIPVFEGNGELKWYDWWIVFEITAKGCYLSERMKRRFLLANLRGPALMHIAVRDLMGAPYEDIVEALDDEFGETVASGLDVLEEIEQGDTELVRDYGTRVRRAGLSMILQKTSKLKSQLKKDGYSHYSPEALSMVKKIQEKARQNLVYEMLLIYFLRGLRHSLRHKMIYNKYDDFESAFQVARELEAFENAFQWRRAMISSEWDHVVCGKCDERGHTASNCRKGNEQRRIVKRQPKMKFSFRFSNLLGTVYQGGNVDFTPDGNVIVSPVGNRLSCFDLKNHSAETLPVEAQYNFSCLSVSPKGRLLIGVSEDGIALLIDLVARRLLHTHKFFSQVKAVKFSPDGKLIAFAKDNGVLIYRAPSVSYREYSPFGLQRSFLGCYATATCLDWSYDSRFVCVGAEDGRICVLSIVRCEQFYTQHIPSHAVAVEGCFFAKDSLDVYSVATNGHLCVWECSVAPEDISFEETTKGFEKKEENEVVEEKKSDTLEEDEVTATEEREVETERIVIEKLPKHLYKRTGKHYLKDLVKNAEGKLIHNSVLTAVAFHPKTRMLVTGFSTGDFFLHEMPEANLVHSLNITDSHITTAAFNDTGDWLALGSKTRGQLVVWEWQSESFILKQEGRLNSLSACAYSADGQFLATGGDDAKLKIWNTVTGFCVVTFSEHTAGITGLVYGPGGRTIVSSSLDGTVRAFDTTRYRNFRTLTTPVPSQFASVSLDPSGEFVCASGLDKFEVYLWSMKTGRLLEVLAGHEAPVSSVCISPSLLSSDPLLASCSWDGTLKLWKFLDSSGASETIRLVGEATCCVLRHDGKEVAVATLNGAISFFDVDTTRPTGSIEGKNDLGSGHRDADRITAKRLAETKCFNSLCYSSDGAFILAAGQSKHVCIYHIAEGLLVKKFSITRNRSLDAMTDFANKRLMTALGNIGPIGIRGEEGAGIALPGVKAGDMAARTYRPEVRVSCVQFSPNGRSFAATTTEGIVMYSLDRNLTFDPYLLEENITPARIRSAIENAEYGEALAFALRLNEENCILEAIESTPVEDIGIIAPSLPVLYVVKLLEFLGQHFAATAHVEFYLTWIRTLLWSHALDLKRSRSSNVKLPGIIRNLMRNLQLATSDLFRKEENLGKICDHNQYLMDFIIHARKTKMAKELADDVKPEEKSVHVASPEDEGVDVLMDDA